MLVNEAFGVNFRGWRFAGQDGRTESFFENSARRWITT